MGGGWIPRARWAAALIAVLSALALPPAGAAAAAPANDDFAHPVPLAEGGVSEAGGATWEASEETGEPDHGGEPGGASLWYSWASKLSGPVNVEVCGGGWKVIVAAYEGTALGGLEPLAFGRATAAYDCAWLTFRATQGAEYRIAVDGQLEGGEVARGGFTIEATRSQFHHPAPANDAFARATPLDSIAANRLFTITEGASREPGEPAHGGEPVGASVWFRWTASQGGPVDIVPCAASFVPVIAVYAGSALGALVPVARPGDGTALAHAGDCQLGGEPGASFVAVAGATYWIAIDGAGGDWGIATFRMEPHRQPLVDVYPPGTYIRKITRLSARRGFRVHFTASPEINFNGGETVYRCKLDRHPYQLCESPVRYAKLSPGRHRFAVYATDGAGNRDTSPAVRTLKIGRGKGKFRVPSGKRKSSSRHDRRGSL